MPLLINEVIAEVESAAPAEQAPGAEPMPLTESETDIAETLALLEERRTRLMVD